MDAATFRKVCELKQEIQRLLAERPELRPLQEKIDRLMAGAGNQHNRCVLITELMKDKMAELAAALPGLQTSLTDFANGLKVHTGDPNETDKTSG